MSWQRGALMLAVSATIAPPVASGEFKLMGSVAAESRLFTENAQFSGQHGVNGSLALQPEFYFASNNGADSFLFTPFARVDQGDSARSHVDIRELTWVRAAEVWELRVGLRRVFWGVAESNHLIDIVNQTDLVENLDTEDKLGQPMVNIALIRPWGTVDLFVLPGFRERTFPGKSGRLRTQPRVDMSDATYESAAEEMHVDFAIRYSQSVAGLDVGVAHFWGTNREPELRLERTPSREFVFRPDYQLIHQTGIDALYTSGSWLWKFEGLRRSGQGETSLAMVSGFEYTLVGIFESTMDLGVLAEYHRDDRGEKASQTFNHDLFLGSRLSVNDEAGSQGLVGIVTDLYGGGRFLNLEFSRRLGYQWTVELEVRAFWGASTEPMRFIESDDYLQIQLNRYF